MAGQPLKRKREAEARANRPRVALPDVWESWTDAERLIFCLKGNLEQIAALSMIPWNEATDNEQRLMVQVHHTHMTVARNILGEKDRDRSRDEITRRLYDLMTGKANPNGDDDA